MKAIKKFLKSDFFMLLCIIIAACGMIGCMSVAEICGGSDKLAGVFAATQLGWVLPLPFHV